MAYIKQTWNNDDANTPLSASRMTHIEDGIEAAEAAIPNDPADIGAAPAVHTHTLADVSGVTTLGQTIVTSATAADARTAISAGTSNFSGDFDDLANIPTESLLPATTTTTDGQVVTYDTGVGVVWADPPVSLPAQTDQGGKVLGTDGTTASWTSLPPTPPTVATVVYSADTDARPIGANIVFWIPENPYIPDPIASVPGDVVLRSQPGEVFRYELSDETTAITAGVAKYTVRAPYDMVLTDIRASLTTASSTGDVVVDINKNGVSVLSTPLTIDANEKSSKTATAPYVLSDTEVLDDDEITFDVDSAGTGATGLKVVMYGVRSYGPGAPAPVGDIDIIASTSSAVNTSNAPAFTFAGYTPVEGDVVLAWAASSSSATISAVPTGWVNVLGGTTLVTPGDGTVALSCLMHVVTSAEVTANTTAWTLTGLWNTAEVGETVATVLRGADPADPMDLSSSTSNESAVTPHVLPGLLGTGLGTGSLVVSCVFSDALATYTPPAGWTSIVPSTNTNQGGHAFVCNTTTLANVDVPDTNVTPSVSDEYASITVAIKVAP